MEASQPLHPLFGKGHAEAEKPGIDGPDLPEIDVMFCDIRVLLAN
jgi:hypothetical protein